MSSEHKGHAALGSLLCSQRREPNGTSTSTGSGTSTWIGIRLSTFLKRVRMTEKTVLPSYDFLYLKQTINEPLTEALGKLCLSQPSDPIDFLGKYLLRMVEIEKQKSECEVFQAKRETILKKIDEETVKARSKEEEKENYRKELKEANETYDQTLLNLPTINTLYSLFFSRLMSQTNASGAWVGRQLKDAEEKAYIYWEEASSACDYMIDQYVSSEEDTIEFDLLKESPEEEGGEGGEEGADETAPPPKKKTYLIIENVLREPRMKYYTTPKLGAYAVFKVSYHTSLYGVNENTEANTEEETNEKPAIVNTLFVGLHTMGQCGRQFSTDELTYIQHWSTVFGQAMEKIEHSLREKEEAERQLEQAEYETLRKEMQEERLKITDNLKSTSNGMDDPSEENATLVDLYQQLKIDTLLVAFYMDKVHHLANWEVPWNTVCLKILTAVLYLMGITLEQMQNQATKQDEWKKIRRFLEKDPFEELFHTAEVQSQKGQNTSDGTAETTKPLTLPEGMRQTIETTTANDMNQPVMEILLKWAQTTVLYKNAVQVEMEKEKAGDEAQ